MTAEILAGIAGLVIALGLSYIPKFGPWFNAQDSATKVQINGAVLIAAALAVFGLGCAGFAAQLGLSVTCNQAGAVSLLGVLITALVANQAAYNAFVKPFPQNNPQPK